MRIADYAAELLRKAGYGISRPTTKPARLYFEDSSLMGLLVSYGTVEQLLGSWRTEQDNFLETHAQRIRASGTKSWNVYSVFLAQEPCKQADRASLTAVAEDLRSTRKIAEAGLLSKDDVLHAILPLLPLQNLVEVQEQDARQVLWERLSLPGPVKKALFDGSEVEEILHLLEAEK